MLKQFAQKVEDLRRLIDDSRSASSSICSAQPLQFLLAVSGGMDSMCMADMFLKTVGAGRFAIAHCNFSLRGEESDGDEALVRQWAENNGVRMFVRRFATAEYAKDNAISIEMAARNLRYRWFADLCGENGLDVLAVAHNANDNAETLMLNLLRGTGLNGLRCMSELGICHPEGSEGSVSLFRPLLEYTRKQIEGYVLTHRVPYRHDSTNFESDYKRNKIRNEVFPVFETMNPSFVRTLNREICYFSEAGSIVEDWCRAHVSDVVTNLQSGSGPDDSGTLSIDTLRLLATPHWRYLLYHILSPYGFNQQTLASIESLLTSSRTFSGKRFDSPTHVLLTGRDTLTVMSPQPSTDELTVVRGHGTYSLNGRRFTVEIIDWDASMPLRQPEGVSVMDAEKLKFPFVCRRWRQGDWFIPFGMKGRKKVSDLFADLKYDTLAKETAMIMVDTQTADLAEQQHVAGVLGLRIDDRYKVTPSTKTVIRFRIL